MKSKPVLKILVIENHEDTLEAMKIYLEMEGHSVETATTMQAALEAASRQRFDLVITDIGLPDGDGWELVRKLHERGPTRAVAMSGYGWKEDVEKSRAAGFEAHLLKPLKVAELEAVLRKFEREI
ncbi:MAG: response regulator, partial [Verrucomicrobia subdivision 3 bacterium]|nr:response regulator [Limisphaerales bacterium]